MVVFYTVVGLAMVAGAIMVPITGREERGYAKWAITLMLFVFGVGIGSQGLGAGIFVLVLLVTLTSSGSVYLAYVVKPRLRLENEESGQEEEVTHVG